MNAITTYDVGIIGGGLAGLTLSIGLAKLGHNVVLFEKETYPFHKVCGEYISLESYRFLETEMGVPLATMQLPIIKKLWLTAPNGQSLHSALPLGGFGISRYLLDDTLQKIAQKHGVQILQNCKVDEVIFNDETFTLKTSKGNFTSRLCCGSWGKRSNFDLKLKRSFVTKNNTRLNNYVGIKYHVLGNFDEDTIALHNFKDGYCGVSKIEEGKYCVCYLTKASNIKNAGTIQAAEEQILAKNPHLKKVFTTMQHCYDAPLTISQVSFSNKTAVQNNILMLGDAAGMITPLCGNGMSIAMHSAKLATASITAFLHNNISRTQLHTNYTTLWQQQFLKRIKVGRTVQTFFGKTWITNAVISILKRSTYLTKKIILQTHGEEF